MSALSQETWIVDRAAMERFEAFGPKLVDLGYETLMPSLTELSTVESIVSAVRILPIARQWQDKIYSRLLAYLGDLHVKSLKIHRDAISAFRAGKSVSHQECYWCREYGLPEDYDKLDSLELPLVSQLINKGI